VLAIYYFLTYTYLLPFILVYSVYLVLYVAVGRRLYFYSQVSRLFSLAVLE